jgi:hypothetical protein
MTGRRVYGDDLFASRARVTTDNAHTCVVYVQPSVGDTIVLGYWAGVVKRGWDVSSSPTRIPNRIQPCYSLSLSLNPVTLSLLTRVRCGVGVSLRPHLRSQRLGHRARLLRQRVEDAARERRAAVEQQVREHHARAEVVHAHAAHARRLQLGPQRGGELREARLGGLVRAHGGREGGAPGAEPEVENVVRGLAAVYVLRRENTEKCVEAQCCARAGAGGGRVQQVALLAAVMARW